MKVLLVCDNWVGGFMGYVASSFESIGNDIVHFSTNMKKSVLYSFKLHHILQIKNFLVNKEWRELNNRLIDVCKQTRPEIMFVMNESSLLPETVRTIQKNGCKTVCYIADNPFDSFRYRYFPLSLKYFDYLLIADKTWFQTIRNVAPKAKIQHFVGGYDPQTFFPIDFTEISLEEKEKLQSQISFTGESYGFRPEGVYRAGILSQLEGYDVKIWGDKGWDTWFAQLPILQSFYQGARLSFDHLRKLFAITNIYLNMPSPQIFAGFQPRVFEIAACKGFQIVDWRLGLGEIFNEDEIVTFKDIPDLIEKIQYFIKYPEKRLPYIKKMYNKVKDDFTWEKKISEITNELLT